MIYLAILFGAIASFFAYVAFADGRLPGDEQGPGLPSLAVGMALSALSAFTAICFLVLSL
ncbi:MAG: hypothetical protein H5U22_06355 [Rhizobium sp.]|nr:hypothetical protein [Rhizobium sp.]